MLEGGHTPVFCIADIPAATLDYFLQCIENNVEDEKQIFFGIEDSTVSDEIAFITSKDINAITTGATRPAKAFVSPFLDETLEQIRDWFNNNIAPTDAYTGSSFLVMDSRTVHDNTCLVVCIDEEIKTVRSDFDVAQIQITTIEFGSEGMEDGIRDLFMQTGEVITKEMFEIAEEGRLYVEDGKLKVQEQEEEEE